MRGRIEKIPGFFVGLLLLLFLARPAVSGMMGNGEDRDGGAERPDVVLRKVTVTPIRAHVGDVIRIDMEWDYWGDITENYYGSNSAEVLANGKVVASRTYEADYGVRPGETKRETLLWDTKGVAPGTYRIRAEVPVRLDKTPYDNYLVVKKPVLLVAAGAAFPAGEESGGTAVAESPY